MEPYARLNQILDDLDVASIYRTLSRHSPGMIMINVAVPGERWETEIEADADVRAERFVSTGSVGGAEMLDDFTRRFVALELTDPGR